VAVAASVVIMASAMGTMVSVDATTQTPFLDLAPSHTMTAAPPTAGSSTVRMIRPVVHILGSMGFAITARDPLGQPHPIRPLRAGLEHSMQASIGTSMLARLSFTFAALVLSSLSAVAQQIPAELALPQRGTPLGKYPAKGVQIYVCRVKGALNEWDFKAPEAELSDAQGRPFARHYAGPTRSEGRRNSLASIVDGTAGIRDTCRGAFCATGQHLRRSRPDRRVSHGRNRAARRLHRRLHLLQMIRFAGQAGNGPVRAGTSDGAPGAHDVRPLAT